MTNEKELREAIEKLWPVIQQAYAITLFVMALYKIEDTPKPVDTNEVGTGDITK